MQQRKEKVHQHQRRLADDIEQSRTARILYIIYRRYCISQLYIAVYSILLLVAISGYTYILDTKGDGYQIEEEELLWAELQFIDFQSNCISAW